MLVGQLNMVTTEHMWVAVQELIGGNVKQAFGPSTEYDLIADDGTCLSSQSTHVQGIFCVSSSSVHTGYT